MHTDHESPRAPIVCISATYLFHCERLDLHHLGGLCMRVCLYRTRVCSTLVRSTLQIVGLEGSRFLYSTPSGAFFLPASIVFLFLPNHRNHKRPMTTPHCGDGSRDHVCLFLYVCIPALAGSNKMCSQLIYEIDVDVTYRYFWRIHLSR